MFHTLKGSGQSNFIRYSLLSGCVIVVTYPIMMFVHGNSMFIKVIELSFGPLFMIAISGLHLILYRSKPSFLLASSLVFHLCAGFSHTLMMAVQRSVFSLRSTQAYDLSESIDKAVHHFGFQVGNHVQLGIDICFDVFISFAIIHLALSFGSTSIHRVVKIVGVMVGLYGFLINLYYIPIPPSNAGVPDPGILFTSFYSLLLIYLFFHLIKVR